jgi:hypothetical protein
MQGVKQIASKQLKFNAISFTLFSKFLGIANDHYGGEEERCSYVNAKESAAGACLGSAPICHR